MSCNETSLREEAIPVSLMHELSRLFLLTSDKKPAPLSRDVEKRQKEAKASVGGAVGVCQKVLEAVLKKPSILLNDEFRFLREFVHVVSTQPELFPPLLPSNAARLSSSIEHPELSKGVASSVYGRQPIPKKMTVVITALDNSTKNVNSPSFHQGHNVVSMSRITLEVADGDHNVLTMKIATQLNSSAALLSRGCIIEILASTPIYTLKNFLAPFVSPSHTKASTKQASSSS